MCEKYSIDDKTRFLVLYFDAQMSIKQISKIINRPLKTVWRWEVIIKNGGDVRIPKQRSGRKKSITEETEDKIIQIVKENPEGASTKKLAARLGVSRRSVGRILIKKGFKYQGFDNTTSYTEEEKMIRVEFCRQMLLDEGRLVYKTFFSDEMGIELNNKLKAKAWQLPAEKLRRKISTEDISTLTTRWPPCHSKVKLSCWGAISAQGATSLDIYDKSMNGGFYREVIKRHMEEMEALYSDEEFSFVQDSHPAHRVNEEWIVNEQKLGLIKLPKRSPDLNIIENLWAALKERVAGDAPTNEAELKASLP